jgi:hypothetical protein
MELNISMSTPLAFDLVTTKKWIDDPACGSAATLFAHRVRLMRTTSTSPLDPSGEVNARLAGSRRYFLYRPPIADLAGRHVSTVQGSEGAH